MMDERVRTLLNEISELEDELRSALPEQQTRMFYRIEGRRIEFEQGIREAQAKLRHGVFKWLAESQLRNVVTAPVIYSMIVPLAFLDLALTVFQAVCFPLYRAPTVKRADYILLDRFHLSYLNSLEKLNCAYCAYAAGVLAYAREIAARGRSLTARVRVHGHGGSGTRQTAVPNHAPPDLTARFRAPQCAATGLRTRDEP